MDVQGYLGDHRARLPQRRHIFVTDPHADADALLDSLQLAGALRRTDAADGFAITAYGRDSVIVLGGDYLDKGPSDLRLLRVLRHLVDTIDDLVLLAGNHDVRTLLGARFAEDQSPRYAHMFVRMGKKVVPLLREVWDTHLADREVQLLDHDEAARRLLPAETWYDAFVPLAEKLAPRPAVDNELDKVRKKTTGLPERLADAGMTLGMAHAAVSHCRALFEPGGEHAWLFSRMRLAHRAESLLFVHAGIDDLAARRIHDEGVEAVDDHYHRLLDDDPFELHYGPVGNVFRTKYRDRDFAFTERGAEQLHRAGIHVLVHGHRTHTDGHHTELRCGLLHLECDTCLDRNTRAQYALPGSGAAATVFDNDAIQFLCRD